MRDTASEFDDLLPAADLTEGVGEHLAVLGGDDRGELGGALLEQLAQAEEDVGALDQARLAPGGEGGGACACGTTSSSAMAWWSA